MIPRPHYYGDIQISYQKEKLSEKPRINENMQRTSE